MSKKGLFGVPGLSFSWKRALGISQAQANLSKQIGVPLSKSGRQRKAGAAIGCVIPIIIVLLSGIVLANSLM